MAAVVATAAGTGTGGHVAPPHILVVPYPAPGHMIPLLDLAAILAARGLRLTIVATPANLPLLDPLLSSHPSVQTLSLPFPSHPSIPYGVENTKNSPPEYFATFIHVLAGLHGPLLSWIQSLASSGDRIAAIMSDLSCGWTQQLAAKLGIPRLVFSPSAVIGTAVVHSLFLRMPKRQDDADGNYPVTFPALPGSPVYPWKQLSRLYRGYVEDDPVSESTKQNFLWNLESWGFVSNTFQQLEATYLARPLQDLGFRRVWSVGPLAPEEAPVERGGRAAVAPEDVAAWLDAFHEGSVVYVSFGSQAILPPPQASALAAALERSGVAFLWALATAAELPEGFEERAVTAGRGIVIRRWAPQVAVLRHRAVGWFVTHCGWNSVIEAAAAGVAMLTWPMTADQFINARLLVEDARVAAPACDGGPDVVPDVDELARVLAESVVGEKGKAVRERAKDLAGKAAAAVREGGSSFQDLEELVQELRKL